MKTSLREIINEIQFLNDAESLTSASSEALDGLQIKLADKLENIVGLINLWGKDIDYLVSEIDRVRVIKTRLEAKKDWLKTYLKSNLEKLDMKSYNGIDFKLSICQNSQPSITFEDGIELPERFYIIKREISRSKILSELKDTGEIPVGVRVETGNHIRIT